MERCGATRRVLTEHEFDYVILDEAQAIKNAATASAKAARLLRGRHRLALSGTPIENHLGELWSLFEFLNPGFLGPAAAFGRAIAPPAAAIAPTASISRSWAARSGRSSCAGRRSRLRRSCPRRSSRRSIASSSPPSVASTTSCGRTTAGSCSRRSRAKGMNRSKLQVLEALLRLRQAASHIGLVDAKRTANRPRSSRCCCRGCARSPTRGTRRWSFPSSRRCSACCGRSLERDGITYEYLDGRTRDRAERVQRFEEDAGCPVFLISLKAGGLGLNLTAADYVFLLDPVVEPRGRGASDRPRPSHRPVEARLRVPPHRPRHRRREDCRAAAEQARAGRRDLLGGRRPDEGAAARGSRVAALVNGRRLPSATNLR